MKSTLWRRAGRASERLAFAVTAAVMSPWSFWILFALCLLQLVSAKIATDVLFISNDIQLLLLPLIGISQSVGGVEACRQAKRDYVSLMCSLVEIDEKIDRILAATNWGDAANGVRHVPLLGRVNGEDIG